MSDRFRVLHLVSHLPRVARMLIFFSLLAGSPKKPTQQRRAVSMATDSPAPHSLDNKVDYEGDAVMASAKSNSDTQRKSTPQSPPNTHTPRKSGQFVIN